MLDQPVPVASPQRPRAVSFVASLVLAEAVAAFVVAGLSVLGMLTLELRGPTLIVDRVLNEPAVRSVSPAAVGALVAGLILSAAGIGLLRMRAWAWSAAVVLHGVTLADALAGYAFGEPRYELMAIGSLVVLVLNQREVRQAFVAPDDDA
ncbi:MAG: hypothetical protein M3O34_12155 [Chloroflexota bacterium]|nr:hypothetical protein [Chloroflexota bacterium]